MLVVLLALAHSTVGVKPRRLPTGYVGLSPTAAFGASGTPANRNRLVYGFFRLGRPHGLRLLPSTRLASRLNETKLRISSEHQSLLRSTQGRRRVAL